MPRKSRPTEAEIALRIALRLREEAERAERAREQQLVRAMLAFAALGTVYTGAVALH
jgi:hypothetical protein